MTDAANVIQSFREGCESYIAKPIVAADLPAKMDDLWLLASHAEVGLVRREIQKRRRHLPIRKLLQVSKWWGNASFDIAVPVADGSDWTTHLVEVKRVGSTVRPIFFLSENERRQACFHLTSGRRWRLWLVASDGQVRDVTWVIDRFTSTSDAIDRLLQNGIRPGEYLFQLE